MEVSLRILLYIANSGDPDRPFQMDGKHVQQPHRTRILITERNSNHLIEYTTNSEGR